MSLNKSLISLLVFTTVCVSLAFFFYQHDASSDSSVSVEILDFGEQYITHNFNCSLPINNNSDKVVNIVGVEVSCSCTSIAKPIFFIPPGGIYNLGITLDLRSSQNTTPKFPYPFSTNISLHLSSGLVVICPIKGVVVDHPIHAESNLLWVVSPNVGLKKKFFHITSSVPLNGIAGRTDWVDAKIDSIDLNNDENMAIIELSLKRLPEKDRVFTLSLDAKDTTDRDLPTLEVPLYIEVASECIISPPVVALGAHKIGEYARTTVSVRLRNRTEKITDVSIIDNNNVVSEFIEGDNDLNLGNIVNLILPITKTGSQIVILTLDVNVAGESFMAELPIRYTGVKDDD